MLPTEGPRITGSKAKYQVGDDVKINCTSALSKPAANLKWYINDQQAPSHYEKIYPLKILSESSLEQVTLGLHFTINSNHFLRGELRMRCTASIHRVYAMSTHAFGTLLGKCWTSSLQTCRVFKSFQCLSQIIRLVIAACPPLQSLLSNFPIFTNLRSPIAFLFLSLFPLKQSFQPISNANFD